MIRLGDAYAATEYGGSVKSHPKETLHEEETGDLVIVVAAPGMPKERTGSKTVECRPNYR